MARHLLWTANPYARVYRGAICFGLDRAGGAFHLAGDTRKGSHAI